MSELLLDAAGRRRSPATLPQFHAGRPPRNKGMRYPADPPTIEGIVAVMRHAGDSVHGRRLRGLIVVLWRAGLRIHEALALAEADLDARRGSLLVRRGKGGRRRRRCASVSLVGPRPTKQPTAWPAGLLALLAAGEGSSAALPRGLGRL
jgi:integrase